MTALLIGVAALTFALNMVCNTRDRMKLSGVMTILIILPSNEVTSAMIAGWTLSVAVSLLYNVFKSMLRNRRVARA